MHRHRFPPRALVVPHCTPDRDLPAAATALRGFIPGALRAWLGDDLQEWATVLRSMSVLFIGVSGLDYTSPDALQRLQHVFTSTQEMIYRYEGSMNKLAVDDKGTILLAMFGAPPLAHADDAVRATQAACDILAMATAQGLSMAIGVATGPVFAGPVGSMQRREYTVMGDAVNRAARLMAAAGPGDIRCDFATVRDAHRVLAFDTLPPVRLKGKTGLARVYRPTGLAHPQASREHTLVGRHTELAQLTAALDAVQAGQPRLVVIEGAVGMGKSCLLEAFVQRARARAVASLSGAGHSSERQTPYRAWREVFNAYFSLGGADGPAERRRLVQTQLAACAPECMERLPLLNDLLGTEFPETSLTAALDTERRYQGREALLIELLCHRLAAGPLFLVLDDAQWMDTGSWGLVGAVAHAVRTARLPLGMVLSMRPIERAERPAELPVLAALGSLETLSLTALTPEDTVALAAAQLGLPVSALPEAVAQLIGERADGNPFFAEEIVLALRDRGVLDVTEEAGQRSCVLQGDITDATLALPDTVQGVILARLDQLNPEEQMLLRVGSVIGRSFPYQTLRAALMPYIRMGDVDMKSRLELLADLDLTSQEQPDPHLQHAFKHLITREVAYGTMLFAQRRELHRRVAEWYEAQYKLTEVGSGTVSPTTLPRAEIINLLAYHYQQAGDTERERRYAALAGAMAAAGFANTEALLLVD